MAIILAKYLSRIVLLLLFIGLSIHNSEAQNTTFTNLTIKEGLPSNEVYQVYADKKGFLWFATDNGVARYDGVEFEQFNLDQGLTDPVVFGIHEDWLGRIWFRTYTGKLCYFENNKIVKYAFNDIIENYTSKIILYDIFLDSKNQLWFSIGDKFLMIDSTGNESLEIVPPHSIVFKQIENKKFSAFSGPIQKIKKAIFNDTTFQISLSDTTYAAGLICHTEWLGREYFSINNDLFEYNGKIKKIANNNSSIISLSVDKENRLWIGYLNGGVDYIRDTTFNTTHKINELNERSISRVFQDQSGGYWITSLEKGVYYFPHFLIREFPLPLTTKIVDVNSTHNHIIIADFSGKVKALEKKTQRIKWEKDLGHAITSLFISSNNLIWIGTNNQTIILDELGNTKVDKLPANIIRFTETQSYIIGINIRSGFYFDKTGTQISSKKVDAQYRSIYSDDKNIFVSGKNGFFIYDKSFDNKISIDPLKDVKITNITRLSDSLLLLSTIGKGFILFNKFNKNSEFYNSNNSFLADNVYNVLMLDSLLLLATENGIAFGSAVSLASGNPYFKLFTKRNGLPNNKVNFIKRLDNEIYAFCDEGYTKLPINILINKKNTSPTAYIKELKINNTDVDPTTNLNLNYNENNIQIKLGFLSFDNQNLKTRFRLNKNHSWINSNAWTYSFNSLSEGHYNFETEYSIDNNNWMATDIKLGFIVNPPWWNSWHFRIAILIGLLFSTYIFFRSRITRLKERNEYLNIINQQQKKLLNAEIEATERERSRIAKDLHDGISIDLMTIKLLAHQTKYGNHLEEIEQQVEKTTSEIKNIVYGLNPPGLERFGLSVGIQHYVERLSYTTNQKINFEYEGEEYKSDANSIVIFRIIQELLTNSLRHSNCTRINIKILSKPKSLNIFYDDNGIGYDKTISTKGLGLNNIHSRVEALNGTIDLDVNSIGTFYIIVIPKKII